MDKEKPDMVTDTISYYTSPVGKEFSLTAARFASLHPSSKILDIGCGFGESVCSLSNHYRCRALAIDTNNQNLDIARKLAHQSRVQHLIEFQESDLFSLELSGQLFDLVLAEGGVFRSIDRRKGLEFMHALTANYGWICFSDLILLTEADAIPTEILATYHHELSGYETEQSYRKLISDIGFEISLMCLVPPSGWDNYYGHIAHRLEDETGFFADMSIKIAFHKEIDVFYRMEAYRYVGYLVGICRKRREK